MKNPLLAVLLAMFLCAACDDDKDENVTCETAGCENGGVCVDGECDCPQGYSGKFCQLEDTCLAPCIAPQECIGGRCQCPVPGYEGRYCDILVYTKYVGSYQVSEGCTSSTMGYIARQYADSIAPGFDIETLVLTNFSSRGLPVDMSITSPTQLTFHDQVVGSIHITSGAGTYTEALDRITLQYSYTFGSDTLNCTATLIPF